MKLHFPWDQIAKLLEELTTATTARPLYGADTGKGLWLVGDHGVYMMANTTDGIHNRARKKDAKHFVVYARECDPDKLHFDAWWANKQASFGGDDGIEFFALADIEAFAAGKPAFLVAECTRDQIVLTATYRS
jgi:hypothetical protein